MKNNNLKPEFVDFKTKDGITLPGLLYKTKKSSAVVIYLHGNGSSSIFYGVAEHQNAMASALNNKGVAILYFNNRGAHLIQTLSVKKGKRVTRKRYGMAFERIKECVFDIDGAVSFLKKQGYKKFYLIGASTGANKICVYNFYKPKNKIKKYILLCGGDDVGIYYHMLGKLRFWNLFTKSKKKIKTKRGDEIIPDMLPDKIFSYSGFYDIANPNGDYNVFPFYEAIRKIKLSKKPLFRYFKSIRKSSLVVYGDKDEYALGNVSRIVEILKLYQPKLDYKIIKGANHGFKGRQRQLANTVADWISEV